MKQEELLNELNGLLNKLDLDLLIDSNDKTEKSKDYEKLLELKRQILSMIDNIAKINDRNENVMEIILDMIKNLEVGSEFTLKTLFSDNGRHEYWKRLYGKNKEIGLAFAKKVEDKEIKNVMFVNDSKEASHTSDHAIEYKKI